MIYAYEVAKDFAHRKPLTNADDKEKSYYDEAYHSTFTLRKINSCLSVVLAPK